jgi:hypothetical protein
MIHKYWHNFGGYNIIWLIRATRDIVIPMKQAKQLPWAPYIFGKIETTIVVSVK